jgi:hypothetical protein
LLYFKKRKRKGKKKKKRHSSMVCESWWAPDGIGGERKSGEECQAL